MSLSILIMLPDMLNLIQMVASTLPGRGAFVLIFENYSVKIMIFSLLQEKRQFYCQNRKKELAIKIHKRDEM